MRRTSKKARHGVVETAHAGLSNRPDVDEGSTRKERRETMASDRLQHRFASGRRHKERSPAWNATAFAGAVIVLVVIIKGYQVMTGWFSPNFEIISLKDTERLRSIVYGGEPWLLSCDYATTPRDKGGPRVHPALMKARTTIAPLARLGTIDCAAELPSGKTVSQRFSLPPDCVGFVAANGEKPKPLTPWAYRQEKNLRDFVQRAIEPTVRTITSKIAFQRACILYPGSCIIVGRKHGLSYTTRQDFLPPILSAARTVRTVAVDTLKYRIALDEVLMGTGLLSSGKRFRDSQGYVVVCIVNIAKEKKQNIKDYSYLGKFFIGEMSDVTALRSFLVECATTKEASSSFPLLSRPPELSWRREVKTSASSGNEKKGTAQDTETVQQARQNGGQNQKWHDEHNEEVVENATSYDKQEIEDPDTEEIDIDDL